MMVAGEPSGDQLAAELAVALASTAAGRPCSFFGAGGPRMAAAGVELAFDLTKHAIIGIPSPAEYFKFRGFRDSLLALARERQPDVFIGVDYFGFNGNLARMLRQTSPPDGRPRIVQFVSPQVWASRPGRARRMEQSHDLLLSILPFEKTWYEQNAPGVRVEFVGHPMIDRHANQGTESALPPGNDPPRVLLLPGSRPGEIHRHLPVLAAASQQIAADVPATFEVLLPNERLADLARPLLAGTPQLSLTVGNTDATLPGAALALASTGTVTLECAWFGVPFIALYKTSWLTYEIGRRIVTVKHLAMPNLLAESPVAPEFIQHDATPGKIAAEAVAILRDPDRQERMRAGLRDVIQRLGQPGAVSRASRFILDLVAA